MLEPRRDFMRLELKCSPIRDFSQPSVRAIGVIGGVVEDVGSVCAPDRLNEQLE